MTTNVKSGKSEAKYLTAQEAANYVGLTLGYLYKLTSSHKIPFYNPGGRKLIFKRCELDAWIDSARVSPDDELERRIQTQMMMGK